MKNIGDFIGIVLRICEFMLWKLAWNRLIIQLLKIMIIFK